MEKKSKNFKVLSQEELNAFEEITNAFKPDFVEPDSNILELSKPVKGKIRGKGIAKIQPATLSSVDEMYIDNLVKKHVDAWLNKNLSTIMRQILNSKIDNIKDAE